MGFIFFDFRKLYINSIIKQMKKRMIFFCILLFLAASSFVGGIFIAEKKARKNPQKVIENSINEEKNVISNSVGGGVEIVELEVQEASEPEAENRQEESVKFSFAVLGDTQYFKPGIYGDYQKAASSIKKINPDLVFSLGDLVSSCDKEKECEEKINSWKNVLGNLSSKTYVMMGNHDRTGKEKSDNAWRKAFNFPNNGPDGFSELTYSFDFQNSHFVILSSDKPEENKINSVQRTWLEQDLQKNTKENTFVFFHEPAYPVNSKIGESLDKNSDDRDALWSIFIKYRVTAVFSGHEHIQARSKVEGIYQFIFGNTDSFDHETPKVGTAEYFHIGKGFGMVEINGKEITVKTCGVEGNILDTFALQK